MQGGASYDPLLYPTATHGFGQKDAQKKHPAALHQYAVCFNALAFRNRAGGIGFWLKPETETAHLHNMRILSISASNVRKGLSVRTNSKWCPAQPNDCRSRMMA